MQGKWICYSGDYELYLAEKVQARRFQRDFPIAPFWRVDSAYHNVRFTREFTLKKPAVLRFSYEGRISVALYKPMPYKFIYGFNGTLSLPAGEYGIEIWVYNHSGLPALKIDSEELITDENWLAGFNQFMMKNCGICDCGDTAPSKYALPVRGVNYVSKTEVEGGLLYDFGKMIMGYPVFKNAGDAPIYCYFGETRSEAMSDNDCEQIDFFTPDHGEHTTAPAKGFQFLRVSASGGYQMQMLEEYDPRPAVFSYDCADEQFKKIVDISAYTFRLCSREFYLDGIKRDRWIWSGDAYLGAKIDYSFSFDAAKIRRTIVALLGKSPVVTYINHIMDYTLYAFLTVREYYEHTGDKNFLRSIYGILGEHLRFVLSRRNADGFLYKQAEDWVHVDWNASLNTDGEVSFEQILLYLALRSFAYVSREIGENGEEYEAIAADLKTKINAVFWNETRGVYLHSRLDGRVKNYATAYANMFAVLYSFADGRQKEKITRALLADKEIPPITTPYMQAFRLACLCEAGEYGFVREELLAYFGNMAKTGTSTFWETYEIGEKKENAVGMYGRAYGRSQCHIWGAGAIYILGRYFYGLKNDLSGGEEFLLTPNLPLISESEICLPLKGGFVRVAEHGGVLSVYAEGGNGKLRVSGEEYLIKNGERLTVGLVKKAQKAM